MVFDEAHKINSNQAGDDTRAVNMMRNITNHSKGIFWKASKLAENELGINVDELRGQLKSFPESSLDYKLIDKKLSDFAQKRDEIEAKLLGKTKPFSYSQINNSSDSF
jgi:hypothetical protein